jgi:hypothetical protein
MEIAPGLTSPKSTSLKINSSNGVRYQFSIALFMHF